MTEVLCKYLCMGCNKITKEEVKLVTDVQLNWIKTSINFVPCRQSNGYTQMNEYLASTLCPICILIEVDL